MSQIETCFFERYALASLQTLLGHRYDGMVNRDRPDLQTPDGKSVGIEVTRAMEQERDAAERLLDEVAGIVPCPEEESDFSRIISSGYGYGLQDGRFIGSKEQFYWKLAKPLGQILESKVSKASAGLYGDFDVLGLYVFCKDSLSEEGVFKTMKHVMDLQEYSDIRYDFLYLSEVSELHVCNLRDEIGDSSRLASCLIPPQLRRSFYLSAIINPNE